MNTGVNAIEFTLDESDLYGKSHKCRSFKVGRTTIFIHGTYASMLKLAQEIQTDVFKAMEEKSVLD